MVYMLDTGARLRYVQPRDPLYAVTRAAIRKLQERHDTLCFFGQNVAEFWCVATRPVAARGGLGMGAAQAEARVRLLQRAFGRLADIDAAYDRWLRLLVACGVAGVQVHDARLAGSMLAHDVTHILTFDPSDFGRYPGITAVHPQDV